MFALNDQIEPWIEFFERIYSFIEIYIKYFISKFPFSD